MYCIVYYYLLTDLCIGELMRPRIEGEEERRLIELITTYYPSMSPTELLQELINTHYDSIYPRGKDNDDIEKKANLTGS